MINAGSFQIRRATEADAEALSIVGARTFSDAFAESNTPEDMAQFLAATWFPDKQRAEIRDASLDTILALDTNGELAGFAQVRDKNAPDGIVTTQPVELQRFYVDKRWHGSGLARALMAAVEQSARARGCRELWLGVWEKNPRAQAFYRKCGFEKVGKKVFVVGTDPQTDDVMMRVLE